MPYRQMLFLSFFGWLIHFAYLAAAYIFSSPLARRPMREMESCEQAARRLSRLLTDRLSLHEAGASEASTFEASLIQATP